MKHSPQKIQLFLFLTEEEHQTLTLEARRKGLEDEHSILFKVTRYIDFLAKKHDCEAPDWRTAAIRIPTKSSKQLCSEFELPNPSHVYQGAKNITCPYTGAISNTITTTCGAASIDPMLNGGFASQAAEHAELVVWSLVSNQFKAHDFGDDITDTVEVLQANFLSGYQHEVPDENTELRRFLARKSQDTATSSKNKRR